MEDRKRYKKTERPVELMQGLSLVRTARELLAIEEEFRNHLNDWQHHTVADFQMETFVQMWSNTSGGFEGIGGDAMTEQRTYVFIPVVDGEDCQVYFGGGYAYSVPYSDIFLEDIKNRQIAGTRHKGKYKKQKK